MYTFSPLWQHSTPIGKGLGAHGLALFLFLVVVWTLAWKGWSLWLAARRHEKTWFIVLLLLNTAGIVDIIYIFLIAKREDVKVTGKAKATKAPTAGQSADETSS